MYAQYLTKHLLKCVHCHRHLIKSLEIFVTQPDNDWPAWRKPRQLQRPRSHLHVWFIKEKKKDERQHNPKTFPLQFFSKLHFFISQMFHLSPIHSPRGLLTQHPLSVNCRQSQSDPSCLSPSTHPYFLLPTMGLCHLLHELNKSQTWRLQKGTNGHAHIVDNCTPACKNNYNYNYHFHIFLLVFSMPIHAKSTTTPPKNTLANHNAPSYKMQNFSTNQNTPDQSETGSNNSISTCIPLLKIMPRKLHLKRFFNPWPQLSLLHDGLFPHFQSYYIC